VPASLLFAAEVLEREMVFGLSDLTEDSAPGVHDHMHCSFEEHYIRVSIDEDK